MSASMQIRNEKQVNVGAFNVQVTQNAGEMTCKLTLTRIAVSRTAATRDRRSSRLRIASRSVMVMSSGTTLHAVNAASTALILSPDTVHSSSDGAMCFEGHWAYTHTSELNNDKSAADVGITEELGRSNKPQRDATVLE